MMFLAILVFVIDVVTIHHLLRSRGPAATKAAWIAVIVILPIVGAVAWLLGSPRDRHHSMKW